MIKLLLTQALSLLIGSLLATWRVDAVAMMSRRYAWRRSAVDWTTTTTAVEREPTASVESWGVAAVSGCHSCRRAGATQTHAHVYSTPTFTLLVPFVTSQCAQGTKAYMYNHVKCTCTCIIPYMRHCCSEILMAYVVVNYNTTHIDYICQFLLIHKCMSCYMSASKSFWHGIIHDSGGTCTV